jgi:hypothetical protein
MRGAAHAPPLDLGPTGCATSPPFGSLVASPNTAPSWNVPLARWADSRVSASGCFPIATAGGLVFIGATLDPRHPSFDVETGREL